MSPYSNRVSLVPDTPHWAALVNDSYYDAGAGDRYPFLKYYVFTTPDEIQHWMKTQKDLTIIKVLYVEPRKHKTVIEIDGV